MTDRPTYLMLAVIVGLAVMCAFQSEFWGPFPTAAGVAAVWGGR